MSDIRIVSTNYTVNSADSKHTIYVNITSEGLFTIKPCFSKNGEGYFNFNKSKRRIIKAIGQLFLDASTIEEIPSEISVSAFMSTPPDNLGDGVPYRRTGPTGI